ncbi:MAG: hypothetical protein ACRC6V_14305 [Bacteroidales bacterium]
MSTTPLNKPKKRGRGRPRSEDKLLIDSERQQFKLKSRIIEVSVEAIETIYSLMMDKSAPPQVRAGNAKVILELSSELHKQLIESEAAEVEENNDSVEDTQENKEEVIDTASIIDWGDFKKVEG